MKIYTICSENGRHLSTISDSQMDVVACISNWLDVAGGEPMDLVQQDAYVSKQLEGNKNSVIDFWQNGKCIFVHVLEVES